MNRSINEESSFELYMLKASKGEVSAALKVLENPVELKITLDKLAERTEEEGTIKETQMIGGYTQGLRPKERFGERGLPQCASDLIKQYKALSSKEGRVNFKMDVQSIEKAIIAGSYEALKTIVERSPMALWCMDFSLSEYEAENVLAFVAKYAPTGSDLEMIDLLKSLGAKLPEKRLILDSGAAMFYTKEIIPKSIKSTAEALIRAGYQFNYADGLNSLMGAKLENSMIEQQSVLCKKIEWLDYLSANHGINWSDRFSHEELKIWCSHIATNSIQKDKVENFIKWAQIHGKIGIGAWVGLSSASLRDQQGWQDLGHWLYKNSMASEAAKSAELSGALITWSYVLPWAEKEVLSKTALINLSSLDECAKNKTRI